MSILPEVLTPVPAELLRKIQPGIVFRYLRFDLATTWMRERKLDSGYLQGGPRIWFWTDGTTMFIRWDNSESMLDGHNMWASLKGTYSMPLEAFIEEVRSFDRRLIVTMEERVQAIQRSWNRPSIRIDTEALLTEQNERASELSEAFHRVANRQDTPWREIAEAMAYFEKLGCRCPRRANQAW